MWFTPSDECWNKYKLTVEGRCKPQHQYRRCISKTFKNFPPTSQSLLDSAFPRFNTIIISLKALDEGYSSKNYVKKFLRALHPEWRAKFTAIEESKDLTLLSFDELIRNLKLHELIINKDSKIVKGKGERRSLTLKDKNESMDEESLTSGSEDEEYVMSRMSETTERQEPNGFVGGSWSDSDKKDDVKAKDETCLMAQASHEVHFESSYFSDENSSIAIRNSLENEISKLKEKVS
nr:hypothetical protein [Tanacetum cinerariifolium]